MQTFGGNLKVTPVRNFRLCMDWEKHPKKQLCNK
jgi:hypothetical protein